MCGIAGLWARRPGADVWSTAARLGPALRHRGPDEAGWLAAWAREGRCVAGHDLDHAQAEDGPPPDVVLAHRRLSIVDLATGWQPLSSERQNVWIVYNGEIYNHLALRAELEALGHRFRTRADTEMVVHAYEAWGPDGFARFNGIFAFAIWDADRRSLVVARDPLGVKPLYLGTYPGGLWLASEVKAAVAAGLCAPAVDRTSLNLYLTYRFVPSPGTMFQGVRRLPPGHWADATVGRADWSTPRRFAPYPAAQDWEARAGECVERLADATRAAVEGQLMSDVPVGALLSGGLDSSIVVAAMARGARAPIDTYAIGIPESGRESELEVARRAAAALGSAHHEVVADRREFSRQWVETIRQLDEPIASPGHVLVGLLCRRVSRDLKVVLTGQGADEPLGGYLRHSVERWIRILGRPWAVGAMRLGARMMVRREAAQRLVAVAEERDLVRRFVTAFAVFSPAQRSKLAGPDLSREADPEAVEEPVRRWLDGTDGLDSLNRLLYVDARLSLADDLLLGSDKVSMASSVEARVPFLDLGFLAVAERIPGRLKVSLLGGRKHLQHLVARRMLPRALADRLTGPGAGWRRKRGFDVPTRRWFEPARLPNVSHLLLGPEAALPHYLQPAPVEDLIVEHRSGQADHSRRLTALVTFEIWHRCLVSGDGNEVAELLTAS